MSSSSTTSPGDMEYPDDAISPNDMESLDDTTSQSGPTSPKASTWSNAEQDDFEEQLASLPEFTRSLLKIQIDVSVTIAKAKRSVAQLLEIGPGSILQFDKHYELPLVMEANHEPIAEGTAVRAGENFGLHVTRVLMPPERFWTVQARPETDRADPASH